MPRAIAALASILITIYALADCIQTESERTKGIPKWAWIILIVIIPWVGPLTWLLIGRDGAWWYRFVGTPDEQYPSRYQAGGPQPGSRRVRPMAPDDDEEFLRRLSDDIDRERRQRRRDEEAGPDGSGPDGSGPNSSGPDSTGPGGAGTR